MTPRLASLLERAWRILLCEQQQASVVVIEATSAFVTGQWQSNTAAAAETVLAT